MKNQLYKWYECEHRVLPWRETDDPYAIWISEIILQQTRVEQGLPYYMRFISRFPDVSSLAAASEDEVLRYWQGLGYYSRARNLHRAAQQIMSAHNGIFPRDFNDLRSLPGIGDYTAGAIAAFAYNMPYPALDGNVYRVLARLTDCEIAFDTSSRKRHFLQIAEQMLDRDNPRLFDSAIMEFGALYCVPQQPDCEHCPLQIYCQAYAHNTVQLLPVRKPRPKLRDRYLYYTIFLSPTAAGSYQTLIHRRTANDIWKHLWEFPCEEFAEEQKQIQHSSSPAIMLSHILSHQRLHASFTVKCMPVLPQISDTKVINISELDDYALSRLTLKALAKIPLFNR